MNTKTNALKATTATEAERTARTNKRTAANKAEAMKQTQEILRAPVTLDEHKTARAGYPIYSTADCKAWVSDLNTRFEVNTARGKSVNVWIVTTETDAEATQAAAQRVADAEAKRSKARNYRADTDTAVTGAAAQQAAAKAARFFPDSTEEQRAAAATDAAQRTAAERAAEAAELDAATETDAERAARPFAYMVYYEGQTEARRVVTTQTAAQLYTETGARLVRRVVLTDAEAAEAAEAESVTLDKAAHRRGKVSIEAARRVYAQQLQAADYEAIPRRVVATVLKRGDAYSNGEVFAKLLRAPWTDARKEDLCADARAAMIEHATEDIDTQYAAMFAAVNHTIYKNRAPYDKGAVYVMDWATFEVQNAAATVNELVKNPSSALRLSWSAFMAELTQRQREVLRLKALGYSARQIMHKLSLKSTSPVEYHIAQARGKAAKYPAQAAVKAQQEAAEARRQADSAQTVAEAAKAHKAEARALRRMRAALALYHSVTSAQRAADAEATEAARAAKQTDRQAAKAERAAKAAKAERAAEAQRAAQRQAERAATAAARAERAQRRTRAAQKAAKEAAERAAARYMDR